MFPIRDHNPSERVPYVTLALIAINVIVFVSEMALVQTERQLAQYYFDYALIPARLAEGENYAALVTSVFLHGGFMHLAGNMLFLWIFGDNMEDEMGHVPFLIFYLACGVLASLAQFAAEPTSVIPMVGASGAIAGVMGGYLLLFPKARVDIFIFFIVFFRIFPIPAWIMLGLWFGLQLLNGVTADVSGGGVAYWAHAGGFVIGLVGTLPLWLRLGGPQFWTRTEGHPPHPEATYGRSSIPTVPRSGAKRRGSPWQKR
ncbi:rhomboid family intramembrane serine protease [Cognatiyoonia sp. IB215446]|uniref:rhomboid family intramembrane serine protease n=1 Tax=Cognatiyoonia sp. IB215446 TaxID=3097355 RepID=UPI002A13C1EC|nr:rhomboid family intramembrane serine protease [Cognatiyoonia sp. IB215446]MDX8347498.1 rhomboid family intramembrane serine protease [Cognatiyoonia sp. IB215446]